ncbi:MAG: ParB/RepB/Spo0J family partition protein [Candidatus Sungbacteria bacterium]|nr:ParB/RepB/Spo0J family partition protein [Candidatus Sungbacteria bacterium]
MALGRGLESLIPQKNKSSENTAEPQPAGVLLSQGQTDFSVGRRDSVFYIELEKIKPNPYQPRREFDEGELASLAESMKQYGMIQPLLVSKIETVVPSGTKVEYQLIAGERRLKAAGLAGLRQVPVIIKNPDEATKLELALIENVQRQNLNPVEEALAYERLMREFKMTQIQVAVKVGKSREVVANRVRILDLPYEVQKNISEGKITEGHAKVLLIIKNPERQRFLAEEAVKKDMSVRELEELVKQEESYKSKTPKIIDPELENYKKNIQDTLGTPVAFSGSREKGKLAISFYSPEDLERILKRLTG